MRDCATRPILFCLALLSALPAQLAEAQPVPDAIDQAKADARVAADRGQQLYDEGRYDEAITSFREADAKFHAPTILLMIARAHERRGRLLEARAHYQQVVQEKLTHYAPKVFFEAQAHAQKELDALLPRIPALLVTVRGGQEVRLLIDGKPATPGLVVELDPGEHTVSASARGRVPEERRVTLAEGSTPHVNLVLKTPPPPPVATQAAPKPPPPETAPSPALSASAQRGYLGPAIGAFGVAGVALGVGVITGALSLSAVGTLNDRCLDVRCYDDVGGETYDVAQTLGTISTVGFVIGGVATAAGIALLLWPRTDGGPQQVGLHLMPGGAAVQGRF